MPIMSSMGALTYGRSSPNAYVPFIGEFIYGGYYAGVYAGKYLIVADAIAGGGIAIYNTAYTNSDTLVLNTYSDWSLPVAAQYPVMRSASAQPTWPVAQAYNVSLSPARNYWTNEGFPKTGAILVTTYIFATSSFDAVFANNSGVSYRAIRLQTIPA